jgi:predicted ABC-type exoprotein transport system permease subunit
MEDKGMKEFSLTALFLVTGLCFFIFSKALQFIDGTHLPVFTWIGVLCILIGSLNSIRTLMEGTEEK